MFEQDRALLAIHRIMVNLHASSSRLGNVAESTLTPTSEVIRSQEWIDFLRSTRRSDCSITILPRLKKDRSVGRLACFRSRFPLQPLVLVTRRDAANLRLARRVVLDEVVWVKRLEHRLPKAIERAVANTFFRGQARRFREVKGLPGDLRRALVLACRCEQPVRSVGELAEAVGCNRRTMWRQWRQVSSEGHLKDLLSWFQLLQGVGATANGNSAGAVARELGLNEKSIGPLAKRLTGRTFTALATRAEKALLDRFREEMAATMFDRIPERDIFG